MWVLILYWVDFLFFRKYIELTFYFLRKYIELTCEWCHIEFIVRELQTTIVAFNDDKSPIKKKKNDDKSLINYCYK